MSLKPSTKVLLVDFMAEGYGLYPFGLYALRAFAQPRMPQVSIDVAGFRMDAPFEDAIADIAARAPDVIGFTCFVWSEQRVHEAVRQLRARFPRAYLLIGGPQVEIGDEILKDLMLGGIVDAVVVGEGERPFVRILQAVVDGDMEGLEGVAGVSRARDGVVRWQPAGDYGKMFEESPNPVVADAELLSTAQRTGVFVYESARGCPYQCTFCDQGVKTFRSRPMAQIEGDLRAILAQNPRKIVFLDSTFNVSPARTRQLLAPIIESGIQIEIEAEVKPERCDPESIELMRLAGFRNIEVGLQSVKAGTLQFIKRNNDFRRIEQSVSWLLAAGIDVHVDTIIGLPGESLSDWLETIDYCFSLGNVAIFSNTLKILPNAEMKQQIEGLDFHYRREKNCAVTRTDGMNLDDINLAKLHQKMIKLYWNRRQDKQSLRDVIDCHYRGRLTAFTRDALLALSQGHDENRLHDTEFWLARRAAPAPRALEAH